MDERIHTIEYHEFRGQLTDTVQIYVNQQYIFVDAVWDTGATYTCISDRFAHQYGLTSIGCSSLSTSDGERESNTYKLDVILLGSQIPVHASSFNSGRQKTNLLIGMDIISHGNFSLTRQNGIIVLTFELLD